MVFLRRGLGVVFMKRGKGPVLERRGSGDVKSVAGVVRFGFFVADLFNGYRGV